METSRRCRSVCKGTRQHLVSNLAVHLQAGPQSLTCEIGPFIGSLPPTKDKELKWWGQTIFSNTQEVLPGRFISTPPPQPDYAQWQMSKRLIKDIDHARDVFYGKKAAGWKMEKHRICWSVHPAFRERPFRSTG